MKKIISILLTVLLLLQIEAAAYHFPPKEQKQELSLQQKVDILKEFEIVDMNFSAAEDELARNITRGEFAKMIAIIMGGKDYEASGEVLFSDVSPDGKYYPYVEYLAITDAISSNYHNGNGNWTYNIEHGFYQKPIKYSVGELMEAGDRIYNFNPDQELRVFEAVKLIIIALGYGKQAVMTGGGYPGGYIYTLNHTDIEFEFDGGKVTVEKALDYVYEAAFCTELSWGSTYYNEPISTTLRVEFLETNDDRLLSRKMYNAVLSDNAALAEEALNMGESPNEFLSFAVYYTSKGWNRERNPLAIAIDSHSYEVAELLLDSGGDADVLDADGATLLQQSDIEFARKLIEHGADVNRRNRHGKSLFQAKASELEGDELLEWIGLCLENGCRITPEEIVTCFDDNSKKPYEMINYFRSNIPGLKLELSETDELFYKAAFGRLEREEADITARNSRNETLINIAAKYGNINNVRLLYEKGADIRVKGYNGLYDALDYAIENGHVDVIKYFAEKGEGVIRRDDSVSNATERNLIECGEKGYYDCLKYVLDTFDIYNKDDVTAGAIKAVKARNLQVLDLFLDHGADIDKVAEECLKYGDMEMARFLIEKGTDFSKFDGALSYVIKYHNVEEGKVLAAFLIEKFPSLIEADTDAVPEAIDKGSIETTKLLIESGIDINKRYYSESLTALMCASDSTDEIYEYLLSAGADVTLMDADGKTAKDYLYYNRCIDYKKMAMLSDK